MLSPEFALSRIRVACLVFSMGIAGAQVYPPGGGYPPGGYPPGGYPGGGSPYPGRSPYPGGGGSPLPIPGRRGQTKPSKTDSTQPLPNFRGVLKHMDEKSIALELGDNRVLDFKRTSKTKFFK